MQRGRSKRHHSEEKEEDGTQGQQMLALRPHLKKPKGDDKEIIALRSKITSDRKHLNELLQQGVSEAEQQEKRRQNEIVSIITDALQTPNQPVNGDLITFERTTIAVNAIYPAVAKSLTASQALVKKYEELEGMVSDLRNEQREPMSETWNAGVAKVESILNGEAKKALNNVKKMLGAHVEQETNNGKAEEKNDGRKEKDEAELNYQLQRSLQYVERGVKRMVKGFPLDQMEN